MLIICCSMPRSGGTLLYQITKEICEQAGIAGGRGFAKPSVKSGVVKTEFCEPWMIDKKDFAFGTYRDFRDVILSLRNFYNRRDAIKNTVPSWTIEDVLRYRNVIIKSFNGWEEHAVWIRYEQNNLAQVMADTVASRLNVELSDVEKTAIIEKYSKENNRQRIKKQKVDMEAGNGSMLTRWHIGNPTNWQSELTPQEVKAIEQAGGDWLKEYGYK